MLYSAQLYFKMRVILDGSVKLLDFVHSKCVLPCAVKLDGASCVLQNSVK